MGRSGVDVDVLRASSIYEFYREHSQVPVHASISRLRHSITQFRQGCWIDIREEYKTNELPRDGCLFPFPLAP